MGEGAPVREVEPNEPLGEAIRKVFERRAEHGKRKLIMETYMSKFDDLLKILPQEKRDTISIRVQRMFLKIGAGFAEYASRFTDFIRNALVAPMIWATKDFPRDKYYQVNLAGAQAWGEFALRTTKTATAERMNYRDHFWNATASGVPWGSVAGAVSLGAFEGMKYGTLAAGAAGAAVGAAAGAVGGLIVSGARSLAFNLQDAIIGPPVVYYDLFSFHGPSLKITAPAEKAPSAIPLGNFASV